MDIQYTNELIFIRDIPSGAVYKQLDRPGELFMKVKEYFDIKASPNIVGSLPFIIPCLDKEVDKDTFSICLNTGKAILWYKKARGVTVQSVLQVKAKRQ